MTEISPQLSAPGINELSSNDLKNLKKQVLKQAYDKEINIKDRKKTQQIQLVNPEREVRNKSEGSLYSSRSAQLLPSYPTFTKELEKQLLKESYDNDILRKNSQRMKQKAQKREDKDILNDLHQYQSELDLKQKKAKQEYAQFLTSEINRKKELQNQLKREEKVRQANRLNRKHGLLNKQHSFKEYFNNVNRYRDNVSTDYLSYINETKIREQERKITDRQMLDRQRKLIQEQTNEERRRNVQRKQELRKVLEQQIMENRSFKSSQLHQFKNRGYIQSQMNLYNPISNPIDYQLDLNNKYVVKQLLEKKSPPMKIQ